MNQLQLIAIAHILPRDAHHIYLPHDQIDGTEIHFYSRQAEEMTCGYSESERPHQDITIKCLSRRSNLFSAKVKEHVYDT